MDLQQYFGTYMKARSGQSLSWDRVHLGSVGAMIIARAVLEVLELRVRD